MYFGIHHISMWIVLKSDSLISMKGSGIILLLKKKTATTMSEVSEYIYLDLKCIEISGISKQLLNIWMQIIVPFAFSI